MQWKSGIGAILLAAMAVMGVVAHAQDSQQKKKDQCRQQLSAVRDEQQQISKQLLELIEKHGTLVMSRDRVLQEMASLEEQAWNGSLAQEETKIRTEVLGERLKKMVDAAKAADSEDEVTALLERKLSIAKAKRNRIEGHRLHRGARGRGSTGCRRPTRIRAAPGRQETVA
jgi:chromosome segregation ATPase